MKYNSNYFYKQYKELKLGLLAAKASLRAYQKERELLIYSGPKDVKAYDPSNQSSSPAVIPVTEIYKRIWELSNLIIQHSAIQDEIELQLQWLEKEIDVICESFCDLELRVFNLHHLKGVKLYEVARITNYSYDWIRQVNKRIGKKMQVDTKKTHNMC